MSDTLAYNHMNYTDNACHDRFTSGQITRMRNILQQYRWGLTYSIGCEEPCSDTEADFTAPTSEIPVGSTVTFENTSTNATSFIWRIDGAEAPDQPDLTLTFDFGGAYEICLDAEGQNCWERLCKTVVVAPICIPSGDTCEILLNGDFEQIKSGQLSNTDFKPVCNWLSTFSSPFFCNKPNNKAVGLWLNTNLINPPNVPTNERLTTAVQLPLQTNSTCVVSFDYLVANKTDSTHSVESILVALTDGNSSGPLPINANIIAQVDTPAVDYVTQQNHDCYKDGLAWHHHTDTFTYNGDGKTYLNLSGKGLAPYAQDSFTIVFIDNVSIRCCGDTSYCSPNPDFSIDGEGCSLSFQGTNAGAPGLYHWDFGDGTTDSVQNVTHDFIFGDTFNVCLTVTCPDSSAFATICKEIEVPGACNECNELEPVTAALCAESELTPNRYLANFCFKVPKGYKACKPDNLYVASPDVDIVVESYEIDTSNVLFDEVCVAITVTPPNGYNFDSLGAVGYVSLCKVGSDMICREFDIVPQGCDNCLGEIQIEAECADTTLSDSIYIYEGIISFTLPTGADFCGYNSPLTGFKVLGTPSVVIGTPNDIWTVNYRITTTNNKLMHTTALLCFNIGNITYCVPLDITIIPCRLPPTCVAAWTPKTMACTDTENGEYVFNIKKQVYAGPYSLCTGGLFGTVDGGGHVTVNDTPTVAFNVFTFDIDIRIPITAFENCDTYNLKLYLCDHLGNVVCYHFPFVLCCDTGTGRGSGAGGLTHGDVVDRGSPAPPRRPVYRVVPNPASDKILVATHDIDPAKQRELRLLDHTGQLVCVTRLIADAETVHVANLPPGVYMAVVVEDGWPVQTEKIVIVR